LQDGGGGQSRRCVSGSGGQRAEANREKDQDGGQDQTSFHISFHDEHRDGGAA
jgi:hypothetical protein